mmetsp:Transcript_117001/g.325317  ORF Transcript_117001/g.325317 Transcript_117001/m.325317 type:complete len:285 (-) Transcript_117001:21-875(-)
MPDPCDPDALACPGVVLMACIGQRACEGASRLGLPRSHHVGEAPNDDDAVVRGPRPRRDLVLRVEHELPLVALFLGPPDDADVAGQRRHVRDVPEAHFRGHLGELGQKHLVGHELEGVRHARHEVRVDGVHRGVFRHGGERLGDQGVGVDEVREAADLQMLECRVLAHLDDGIEVFGVDALFLLEELPQVGQLRQDGHGTLVGDRVGRAARLRQEEDAVVRLVLEPGQLEAGGELGLLDLGVGDFELVELAVLLLELHDFGDPLPLRARRVDHDLRAFADDVVE